MSYKRVNWENAPSEETPVNADNLNNMDEGIKNIEDGTTKVANASEADNSQTVRGLHLEFVESGEEIMEDDETITIPLSVSQPYVLQWRAEGNIIDWGLDQTHLMSVRKGREYIYDEDIERDILEVKNEITIDSETKFIYEIYVIKN